MVSSGTLVKQGKTNQNKQFLRNLVVQKWVVPSTPFFHLQFGGLLDNDFLQSPSFGMVW